MRASILVDDSFCVFASGSGEIGTWGSVCGSACSCSTAEREGPCWCRLATCPVEKRVLLRDAAEGCSSHFVVIGRAAIAVTIGLYIIIFIHLTVDYAQAKLDIDVRLYMRYSLLCGTLFLLVDLKCR